MHAQGQATRGGRGRSAGGAEQPGGRTTLSHVPPPPSLHTRAFPYVHPQAQAHAPAHAQHAGQAAPDHAARPASPTGWQFPTLDALDDTSPEGGAPAGAAGATYNTRARVDLRDVPIEQLEQRLQDDWVQDDNTTLADDQIEYQRFLKVRAALTHTHKHTHTHTVQGTLAVTYSFQGYLLCHKPACARCLPSVLSPCVFVCVCVCVCVCRSCVVRSPMTCYQRMKMMKSGHCPFHSWMMITAT